MNIHSPHGIALEAQRRAVLEAFSRGEMTTPEVTARLGLDYGAVLDLLRDAKLPRYRLPDAEARPMIEGLVAALSVSQR